MPLKLRTEPLGDVSVELTSTLPDGTSFFEEVAGQWSLVEQPNGDMEPVMALPYSTSTWSTAKPLPLKVVVGPCLCMMDGCYNYMDLPQKYCIVLAIAMIVIVI